MRRSGDAPGAATAGYAPRVIPERRAELDQWIERLVTEDKLTGATLSNPHGKDVATKITVDPVEVRAGHRYRLRHHHAKQTIDETLTAEQTVQRLRELLGVVYRQGLLRTRDADFQVLGTKVLERPASRPVASKSVDRKKHRLLPEGEPVPFLVELGVTTKEGVVRAQRQDKFRQVNRFLELVDDVIDALPPGPLRIVDFGSGRAYLTFALHHLLHVVHGREVDLIGLDLKENVVAECNALAQKLGLANLRFTRGDIASATIEAADLVVSLHACDTATDSAMLRAVELGAKVILAVPCCQHELMGQLQNVPLEPLLRHGALRERFAAEVTDAARARLLSLVGYDVQLVELFALEHSPKNILIRASALKRERPAHDTARLAAGYRTFADTLAIDPALERMLADRLPKAARSA